MTDWSTTSNLARQACADLGFNFDVGFVSARQGPDKIIEIRGTCGKPDEFRSLRWACEISAGRYSYVGLSPT